MKKIKVMLSVEEDKNVKNVIDNVRNFLVEAPVEISFKFEVADEMESLWVPVK